MSMQIKRGTTDGWKLGPELVNFEAFSVNGSDSTKHCEGNTIVYNIGTTSASDFTGDGVKENGIWLIKDLDAIHLTSGVYKLDLTSKHLTGDTSASWGISLFDTTATHFKCSENKGGPFTFNSSFNTGSNAESVYFFVPEGGKVLQCACKWSADIPLASYSSTISIRKLDDYGELLPGQLGAEFEGTGGQSYLKIGPQTIDNNTGTKWSDIKYVGQVLPSEMYGTDWPKNPVQGQIFYKKAQ